MERSFISRSVTVRGRVQGVYFRAYTRDCADSLGIRGWVRNDMDGSVRAILQHSNDLVLDQMISLLNLGPPSASVESVEFQADLAEPQHDAFMITT